MPHKDPEARRAYGKKRYREKRDLLWKNPDGSWKKANAERRNAWFRNKYRNDPEFKKRQKQYAAARTTARRKEGPCPCCGIETRLVWDHDHSTGKFRDWICSACNLAIGHAKENTETLLRLVQYLKKHSV